MEDLKKIVNVYLVLQSVFVLSRGFTDPEPGPGAFKIEGRAIVSGIKSQEWVSSARVLVEGGEYVGFLR